MKRLLIAAAILTLAGCQCGLQPVTECNGTECADGGTGGGSAAGGGDADAGQAGGTAATGGGDVGGGSAATGGGDVGGGSAATGGGDVGGGTAVTGGGSTGGGSAVTGGGSTGGGSTGGGTATTGGGSATGGGSPDAGIQSCAMVARAKCEYFSRCNLLSDDTLVTGRTNTLLGSNQLATCIAQQTNDSTCQVGQMAINLGRLSFNDAAFTACMTALYPAGSCVRDLNAIAALCKTKVLVTGTGSVGAACTSDFECTGSYCAIAQGSVCGVCTAWANVDGGVGSRCSKDSMCDPTRSYCPGSDGNPPQNNTTCATYKGLDAGCNGSQTEIAQQEECGPGNVCAGGLFGGPNRCIVGKLEGAACTKNQLECARSGRTSTELTCATTGPTTSVCTKVFNTTAGGNCGTGEATSLTQAAPPYCLESEFCSQNVCTPRRAMNQACTDTTQCQAGLRCTGNFGNRFCLPYADVGANCQQTNECRGLLSCVNNSCVASLAPLGSPCSLQNNSVPQCAEGYCEGNGSAIGTCTALKADGQTCARNNQCQSYSCVNGMCAHACWQP